MHTVRVALGAIVNTEQTARMFEDFSPEGLEKFKAFANSDLNPIEYLSIDPGKANGVTGYDTKCYLQFLYTVPVAEMTKFLDVFDKLKTCVIEDYRLYPNKAKDQIYSDMETPRVIGKVEHWAELKGIELVKQPATVKKTGYAWAGQKPLPKSNPMNHARDAHIHFIYWGVKTQKINPSHLLKGEKQP